MIWRTCGSREQVVRAQRVLDPGGRVRRPGGDEAQVLRRVRVVAQLAQAAGQLGRRPEGRHPIAADEPGDRRVIDAGLLGQLPLRHLLGLELGSQPLVERSAVLGRHVCLGAPWADRCGSGPARGASMPDDADAARACITRWYRVGRARRRRCGAGRCGAVVGGPLGSPMRLGPHDRGTGRAAVEPSATPSRGRRQTGVDAGDARSAGSAMRPGPRGFDDSDVRDRPEDDDREHADDPVEQGDRGGLGQRHAVGDGSGPRRPRPRRSRARPG